MPWQLVHLWLLTFIQILHLRDISSLRLPHKPLFTQSRLKGWHIDEDSEKEGFKSLQNTKKSNKKSGRRMTSRGTLANVHYRSIPMEDLRVHPLFNELPEQLYISQIEDISCFRQDSWQWTYLHRGRLTTSKAAAMLGIYDNKSATALQIPRSLVGHEKISRALKEIITTKTPRNQTFIDFKFLNREYENNESSSTYIPRDEHIKSVPWKANTSMDPKFPYLYISRKGSKSSSKGYASSSAARLAWGNAQEATAILCALNYLFKICPSARLHEIGLLAFEALPQDDYLFQTDQNYVHVSTCISQDLLPDIGASPDGLIHYSNGSLEVLEVKCSSPFAASKATTNNGRRMYLHKRPPIKTLGAWHICQLQLEIFCAGPRCKSALVVLLSGLHGAVLLRVMRDDEYISRMIQLFKVIHRNFLRDEIIFSSARQAIGKEYVPTVPIEDYFYSCEVDEDTKRVYLEFIEHTKEMAESSTLLVNLTQSEIQRSTNNNNLFVA